MKGFDQETLNKLVDMKDSEPSAVELVITSNCTHRRFEDLDCVFVCGLNGGYDTCKCECGKLCEDFEPGDINFDMLVHEMIEEM